MKKKIIIMASALALSCMTAMADKQPGLEFVFKQGTSATFAFANYPKIEPTADGVQVSDDDTKEIDYLFSDIQKIVVVDDVENVTGIGNVSDSSANLVFQCIGDVVSVSGMNAGEQLTVVSAGGQLVGKAVAGSDGKAEVSLGNAAKGVYVVAAQGVSYKISKK